MQPNKYFFKKFIKDAMSFLIHDEKCSVFYLTFNSLFYIFLSEGSKNYLSFKFPNTCLHVIPVESLASPGLRWYLVRNRGAEMLVNQFSC